MNLPQFRIKILNLDTTPDLDGEFFDPEGVALCPDKVPVCYDFDRDVPERVWGNASLEKTADGVYANIELHDPPTWPDAAILLPDMYPSVGGSTLAAEPNANGTRKITKCYISMVGLHTGPNKDLRIKRIGDQLNEVNAQVIAGNDPAESLHSSITDDPFIQRTRK